MQRRAHRSRHLLRPPLLRIRRAEGRQALAGLGGLDPALLGKLLPLAQEYGRSNSASMQLLNALRPFLKPEKQGKVERAAHLARLIHLGKKFLSEWEG